MKRRILSPWQSPFQPHDMYSDMIGVLCNSRRPQFLHVSLCRPSFSLCIRGVISLPTQVFNTETCIVTFVNNLTYLGSYVDIRYSVQFNSEGFGDMLTVFPKRKSNGFIHMGTGDGKRGEVTEDRPKVFSA